MQIDIVQAVLSALTRVLADGGADADVVGLRVERSGEEIVVSFNTLADDPRIAVAPQIRVRLNEDEAFQVARADTYVPAKTLGHNAHGLILAVGEGLPGGLGLEIEDIVQAASHDRIS